jgi:hypothetical protein
VPTKEHTCHSVTEMASHLSQHTLRQCDETHHVSEWTKLLHHEPVEGPASEYENNGNQDACPTLEELCGRSGKHIKNQNQNGKGTGRQAGAKHRTLRAIVRRDGSDGRNGNYGRVLQSWTQRREF